MNVCENTLVFKILDALRVGEYENLKKTNLWYQNKLLILKLLQKGTFLQIFRFTDLFCWYFSSQYHQGDQEYDDTAFQVLFPL